MVLDSCSLDMCLTEDTLNSRLKLLIRHRTQLQVIYSRICSRLCLLKDLTASKIIILMRLMGASWLMMVPVTGEERLRRHLRAGRIKQSIRLCIHLTTVGVTTVCTVKGQEQTTLPIKAAIEAILKGDTVKCTEGGVCTGVRFRERSASLIMREGLTAVTRRRDTDSSNDNGCCASMICVV